MRGELCELEVCVHGKPCHEYPHEGRFFIEGRKGSEFTLRVRNRTWKRLLVVLSVDGLSIMDGKPASIDGSGYILYPQAEINIPGWSLDDKAVAKFIFAKEGQSYNAQSGQDKRNIGVIGCALFKEKEEPEDSDIRYRYLRGHSKGARGMMLGGDSSFFSADTDCCVTPSGEEPPISVYNVQSEIGTGFGAKQDFHTVKVNFERSSATPDESFEITYDTREGLKRRGVNLDRKPEAAHPNPFPADQGCKPPPGWRG